LTVLNAENIKEKTMKKLFGLIIFCCLLVAFVSTSNATDAPPAEFGVLITCSDIFTFGDVRLVSTTFSGKTMTVILSAPRQKLFFSSADGGCWKYLGSNDRPKKKERSRTE